MSITPNITTVEWSSDNILNSLSLSVNEGILSGSVEETGDHPLNVAVRTNYGLATGVINVVGRDGSYDPVIADEELFVDEGIPVTDLYLKGTNIIKNNQAPVITSPATDSVAIGKTFTYQITTAFTDTVKQVYSVTSTNNLTGLTINSSTGVVEWAVPATYNLENSPVVLTVGVENSCGTSTKDVSVNLENPYNYIPVITSDSIASAEWGTTFTYQVETYHPEDAGEVYSVSGAPEGSTFDTNTGVFTWNVPDGNIDFLIPYTVTFTVTNRYGQTASKSLTISFVASEKYRPVIDDNQEIVVNEGVAMTPQLLTGTNIHINTNE